MYGRGKAEHDVAYWLPWVGLSPRFGCAWFARPTQYEPKLRGMVATITTIGRKVVTVEYKNLCFAMRCSGGQDKIQPRRRQFYRRVHGPVYAVDSNDRDKIEEANEELIKVPNEDEICDAAVLSGLHNVRKRVGHSIRLCSAGNLRVLWSVDV